MCVFSLKNTKPIMEKRRRERINRSLEELKDLILDNATTNVINIELVHSFSLIKFLF